MVLTYEINLFQDQEILKRFTSQETSLTLIQGKISAIVSESQISELQGGGYTMYSRLSSAEMTLKGLNMQFSELNNVIYGDGSKDTTSRIHTIEASVDKLDSTIQHDYVTTTSLNSTLGDYVTTTSLSSQITQTEKDIYASVSSTYVTTSQYNHRTYRQSTAPTSGMTTGDLWIDTSTTDDRNGKAVTNNRLYRYNGSKWVDCTDGDAARLEVRMTAAELAITPDAITSTVRDSGLNKTYRQSTAPTSEITTGDLWIDSDDGNKIYRYSGSSWISVQDTNKNKTFRQPSEPTSGMIAGDLWIDSDGNNQVYRYSGSGWTQFLTGNNIASIINQDATTVSISASKINLTADTIKAKFNGISSYIQMETSDSKATFNIYDGTATAYNRRLRIDEEGSHFWRNGYEVGKIGTNTWKNYPARRGLVFDLEYNSYYMAWAWRESSSAADYTSKWCYAAGTVGDYTKGRLHAGADIDMHYYGIRNAQWPDGNGGLTSGLTQTFNLRDKNSSYYWTLKFVNGILVG